jgi:hypothetical protein
MERTGLIAGKEQEWSVEMIVSNGNFKITWPNGSKNLYRSRIPGPVTSVAVMNPARWSTDSGVPIMKW